MWSVWGCILEVAPIKLTHGLDVEFEENIKINHDSKNFRMSSWVDSDVIYAKGESLVVMEKRSEGREKVKSSVSTLLIVRCLLVI